MAQSVLYMSMSVDGFVAGPNEGPGNGLGDGGMRLHEWLLESGDFPESGVIKRPGGVNGEIFDEFMSTGAVVAGATTFEMANGWGGDHHDGVPIYILSRHQPPPEFADFPLVTYTDDIEWAMAQAKEAAGEKDILVHGVGTTRLALEAGVLDEIQIHQVPVLLGEGVPLFEDRGPKQLELELTRVVEGNGVTHLRYAVQR
jgi:dihydrofolate reductase